MTSGENSTPPLFGLVLAGGKSLRMGTDKGAIKWHGTEQRYYIADILKTLCEQVFISCRREQANEINSNYQILPDTFPGSGPLAAILSAFQARPGVAWLVVACDLPLLDVKTLQFLVANRSFSSLATTFKSPHDGLPEPLITIWEPSAFDILKAHIDGGYTCPRKALIRNEEQVSILMPPDPDSLMNANTPGEAEKVKGLLTR